MTKVREYSYISTLRTKGPSIYYLEARHASDSLSTLPCRYDDPDLGCGSKILRVSMIYYYPLSRYGEPLRFTMSLVINLESFPVRKNESS